jgi:phosphocarrier protein
LNSQHKVVELRNRRGLHARASAKFVTLASSQKAEIEVEKDGSSVCGTSIMGLMMLGAAFGDQVTIRTKGEGAEQALQVLVELVEGKFGED